MNVSLFQAAAAMSANSRWQETIAENLATSSIPGARKQDVSFQLVGPEGVKGNSATQASMLVPRVAESYNFSPGPIRPGAPDDLAIVGKGFFEVRRPDGSTGFTRGGEFHFNAENKLVNSRGYELVGSNGPVQQDPNNPGIFSISPTGEISQGPDKKGTIALADFDDPSQLTLAGDGLFEAKGGVEKKPATNASLRQGFVEMSNISVTGEMVEMIQAMRSFEANQKVIRVADERMSRAITQLSPTP